MKIGEDRLFPAIQNTNKETEIAAAGTSCRNQIVHGTGENAHHPIELIRAAIVD